VGFADSLNALTDQPPKRDILPWLLEQLGDEAAALEVALADPMVPGISIVRALRSEGHTISDATVRDWCRKART